MDNNNLLQVIAFCLAMVVVPQDGKSNDVIDLFDDILYDATCLSNGAVSAHWRFSGALYRIDRECTNNLWNVVLPSEGCRVLNKVSSDNQEVILQRGERIVFIAPHCKGYFANITQENVRSIEEVPKEYYHARMLFALRFCAYAEVVLNGEKFIQNELCIIDPIRNRAWSYANRQEEFVRFPFVSARIPRANLFNNISGIFDEAKEIVFDISETATRIRRDSEREWFQYLSRKTGETIGKSTCYNDNFRSCLHAIEDHSGLYRYLVIGLTRSDTMATISCLDDKGRIRLAVFVALPEGAKGYGRYQYSEVGALARASLLGNWNAMKGYSFPQRSVVPMQDKECEEFNLETDAEIRALLGLKPARAPLTREDVRKIVEEKL